MITLNSERQRVLTTDFLTVNHDDLESGEAAPAFKLPVDAVVVGGEVVVDTAFDSGTSDTLDVGDGDDDDRYSGGGIDLQSTGRTALTLTGYRYSTPDTVDALLTSVGTARTAGSFRIRLEYVIQGRGDENQD